MASFKIGIFDVLLLIFVLINLAAAQSCTSNVECPGDNMQCIDANCLCDTGYMMSTDNDTCTRVLGSTCYIDIDCPLVDSFCNVTSVCACSNGFIETGGGSCIRGLNSPCTSQADCMPADLACIEQVCTCYHGHRYDSATCIPILGDTCYSDADCELENTQCDSSVCTCAQYYEEYNNTCTEVPPDPPTLDSVRVVTTQTITGSNQTAALLCDFNVDRGYLYNVTWYRNGNIISSYVSLTIDTITTGSTISEDQILSVLTTTSVSGVPFNTELKCSVTLYSQEGEELLYFISDTFIPIQLSSRELRMTRAETVSFTIILRIPYGCPSDTAECYLQYLLYDAQDRQNCWYSAVAFIHSDTCGGRVEGSTAASTNQIVTWNHVTNITLTTTVNKYYSTKYAGSNYNLKLLSKAVGNTHDIWNSFQDDIHVNVSEPVWPSWTYSWYSSWSGRTYTYTYYWAYCYVTGDPYMYTFDWKSYGNQNKGEFVLVRHKTYPIEVQMETKPCFTRSWWWTPPRTCACALTVRAGRDVFTINHCSGHLTEFLSHGDGALKVLRYYETYYKIYLPTGMMVTAYIMPYMGYTMNIMIYPTAADINQIEGLCGNYNGDQTDEFTPRVSTGRRRRSHWYRPDPDEFSMSWELEGRPGESLLNEFVYKSASPWPQGRKLCVCPHIARDNNHQSVCSNNEADVCVNRYFWGTWVTPTTSARRAIGSGGKPAVDQTLIDDLVRRMTKLSRQTRREFNKFEMFQRYRRSDTPTNITLDDAVIICNDSLTTCPGTAAADVTSSDYNTTLRNCAQDVMVDGTSEWIGPHCDAATSAVLEEIENDENITANNPDIVEFVKANSCPSNCSDHGLCINGTCACFDDFGTDLCLLQLSVPPEVEDVGIGGVCDVSTGSTCDFIRVTSNGFVQNITSDVTTYIIDTNGTLNEESSFNASAEYLSFNEALVPTVDTSTARRRRDVTSGNTTDNATTPFARMISMSLSNNGVNFGQRITAVILDTTCQVSGVNSNNETVVTLMSGYCYIDGVCVASGTTQLGDACFTCVPGVDTFDWSFSCTPPTGPDQDSTVFLIIVIVCPVVGLLVIVAVVIIMKKFVLRPGKVCAEHDVIEVTSLRPSVQGPRPYGGTEKKRRLSMLSQAIGGRSPVPGLKKDTGELEELEF